MSNVKNLPKQALSIAEIIIQFVDENSDTLKNVRVFLISFWLRNFFFYHIPIDYSQSTLFFLDYYLGFRKLEVTKHKTKNLNNLSVENIPTFTSGNGY